MFSYIECVLPQNQQTPLHVSAAKGSEAACRVLIEHRANVNAQDKVMRGRREGCVVCTSEYYILSVFVSLQKYFRP